MRFIITLPTLTLLFICSTVASRSEVDLTALEKRVAALEAEVATLKAQKAPSETLDPDNLDPETRKKLVADEVRRRRAKREAADEKKKANEAVPSQSQ